MKRITFILIALSVLVFAGCGDKGPDTKPDWSNWGNQNPNVNPAGTADVKIQCVDVVDTKNLVETEITEPAPEIGNGETGEDGGMLPGAGPTTTKISISAVQNIILSGETAKAADEEDTVTECVENEIKSIKKTAHGEYYWDNLTWLLTRERLAAEPLNQNVEIVPFQSCGQVKQARCLLIR